MLDKLGRDSGINRNSQGSGGTRIRVAHIEELLSGMSVFLACPLPRAAIFTTVYLVLITVHYEDKFLKIQATLGGILHLLQDFASSRILGIVVHLQSMHKAKDVRQHKGHFHYYLHKAFSTYKHFVF